jgi:hypothetical protein
MLMALIATSTGACAAAENEDLALPEDWSLVDAAEDPVPDRPDGTACPERALVVEAGYLELDTAACGWITAMAPARHGTTLGDPLQVFAFHTALVAEETAEAVFSLYAEDTLLWEQRMTIPASGGFFEDEVILPRDLDAGTPLYVHVHNHGANSYRLAHVRAPRR